MNSFADEKQWSQTLRNLNNDTANAEQIEEREN